MMPSRNPYPSDVSDDEWTFVAPYLTLLPEDAVQSTYHLGEVFNGLRWIARASASWRMMPNDLPSWWVAYQQTQRWLAAGCFATIVDVPTTEAKRGFVPAASAMDGRTLLFLDYQFPLAGARL
jgi:transposase